MKKILLTLAYKAYRLQWWLTRPLLLGVRVILIKDGQVLLVQHTYQDQWFFPGGSVKRGETLAQAAERECIEEAGTVLQKPLQLLGVYTNFYENKSDHIAVFYTDKFELQERTDRWEIEEMAFFPLDQLPEDLSPGSDRRLKDYLAGSGPYAEEW